MLPDPFASADAIEAGGGRCRPIPSALPGAMICALVDSSGLVVQANRRLRGLLPATPGARFDALLESASASVWRGALETAVRGAGSEIELVMGPGMIEGSRYRCVLEPGDEALVWVFAEPVDPRRSLVTAVLPALEQARAEAVSDPLTGLANRRQAERWLEACVAAALAQQQPLGCIMVDLDHFKRVNDTLGHPAGDRVLREIATGLSRAVRAPDQIARYGGDEFLILLPNTDLKGAMALAARLRLKLARAHAGSAGQSTTASFGVAALVAGEPAAALLARADTALLRAKRAGRNRVERGI